MSETKTLGAEEMRLARFAALVVFFLNGFGFASTSCLVHIRLVPR